MPAYPNPASTRIPPQLFQHFRHVRHGETLYQHARHYLRQLRQMANLNAWLHIDPRWRRARLDEAMIHFITDVGVPPATWCWLTLRDPLDAALFTPRNVEWTYDYRVLGMTHLPAELAFAELQPLAKRRDLLLTFPQRTGKAFTQLRVVSHRPERGRPRIIHPAKPPKAM